MATVTDTTGSQVSVSDLGLGLDLQDSNVNVFEFGNLILADILPSLNWMVSQIRDSAGNLVSISDSSGSEVSGSDAAGSSSSVIDMSGS